MRRIDMNKSTKMEIEQPDYLQTAANSALEYMKENQKQLLIILGAFILILVGSLSWFLYDRSIEREAQKIYAQAFESSSQIINPTDQAGFESASSMAAGSYNDLIAKYPRTKAAALARYNLGSIYLRKGDIDKAIAEYNRFINETSDSNDLRALALNGLGFCYEAKKDFPKALDMYQKSLNSKEGSAYIGMTYKAIASIYERQGKKAEAVNNYRKALEQKNEPMIDALIKMKIAELS
jgi:predicted negative regulator of RcsB-dependent stress response